MSRIWTALIFSIITAGSVGAQDWTVISSGTTEDIHSLSCVPSLHGWLAGSGGYVAESDFSHTIWTQVNVGTTADLISIIEPGTQIASGSGGTVRVNYNGSWVGRNIPDATQDFVLFSRQNFAAYAVGNKGSIYYTQDFEQNGNVWTYRGNPTPNALHAGADGAYAVGDMGTFVKSTDQGVHWLSYPTGTTANLYAFLDGNSLFELALGEGGTIIKSTDGGVTWSPRNSGTTSTLRAIGWADGYNFVAVGDYGTVLKTTNSGDTWCRLNAGTTANLYAVAYPGYTDLLVAGQGGLLLRSTTGGGPCVDPAEVEAMSPGRGSLSIAGPFPNPVRSDGEFELASQRDGVVQVDVCDVSGRFVARLLDGPMRSGERRLLQIPARGWPQGTYFIDARESGTRLARQVLILR